MDHATNQVLAHLPQNIIAALQPHLKTIELPFGRVVAETAQPIREVLFPFSGVVSLVVEMEVGDMIETAMVGRDGVVNGTAALDSILSMNKGIVQVAGAAYSVDADTLRSIANDFEPLRSILVRHEQLVLAQAQQSAGCNASHTVEARMCRWLLRIRDLTQADEIRLTQEFLAQMLGVNRTSVSVVAGTLQKAGFLSYRRGIINILDLNAVRSGACECYERVRRNYDLLFEAPAPGKHALSGKDGGRDAEGTGA